MTAAGRWARNRDRLAGALVALIGAGAIVQGRQYGVGGLADMGSGFFPVVLGAGMVILGGVMAAFGTSGAAVGAAGVTTGLAATEAHAPAPPDWRGGLAILVAVALFVLLADSAGLAPATFACVFAGALGSRETTWREALLLAAGVTVFGVVLFSLILKVQFPILRGVLS